MKFKNIHEARAWGNVWHKLLQAKVPFAADKADSIILRQRINMQVNKHFGKFGVPTLESVIEKNEKGQAVWRELNEAVTLAASRKLAASLFPRIDFTTPRPIE